VCGTFDQAQSVFPSCFCVLVFTGFRQITPIIIKVLCIKKMVKIIK
jgi:hypothetical protein